MILIPSSSEYLIDKRNDILKKIVSMLVGGLIMITGYFLYVLLIDIAVEAALLEIPWNTLQCVFGMIIALPIIEIISKSLKI
jgi:uncharacterized membrane protein